jgi:glucose-1-phosphate cytidylyltransferase
MKIIILAGGLGTRLSEETETKPKPMVLIDDKPLLWHLMNIFSMQGYNEFVLALGYRSEIIKRWLLDLHDLDGNITINTSSKQITHFDNSTRKNWNVTAIETGLNTQTGGRIAKCMQAFPGERMIATYGDGLSNISINRLLEYHKSHGRMATVTAVRPPARFGHLKIENDRVTHFGEKNQSDEGWINGGFFVLEPGVENFVKDDSEPFEIGALPKLASMGELMAHFHHDFWQSMDTLRDKLELEKLAKEKQVPWFNNFS